MIDRIQPMTDRNIPILTRQDIDSVLDAYKELKFFRLSNEMQALAKLRSTFSSNPLTAFNLYHVLRVIAAIDPDKSPKSFKIVARLINKFHANDIAAVKAHLHEKSEFLQNSFGTVLKSPAEYALDTAFSASLLTRLMEDSTKFYSTNYNAFYGARELIVKSILAIGKNKLFASILHQAYENYPKANQLADDPTLIIGLLKPLFAKPNLKVAAPIEEEKEEPTPPIFHEEVSLNPDANLPRP